MLDYTNGNIFDSRCQAIVNPVNCVGVMGAGLALQFKQRFPENFSAYAEACRTGALAPGRMHVFDTGAEHPRFIINFPTKRHWRDPSRIEDIASGIEALDAAMSEYGIQSIAIPPLGAGLGGLPWTNVRDLLAARLSHREDIEIAVYEPHRTLTEDAPVGRPLSEPRPAMNPEIHAFFLDPEASPHPLHADIVQSYRPMSEQAGDRHELIAYSDEFDGLLEDVRDYVRNPDEDLETEYLDRLALFRDKLSAIDIRRTEVSELQIEINQRLEQFDELLATTVKGQQIHDHDYQSWRGALGHTLSQVERLRADPDMAVHLDHVLTDLPALADAAAAPSVADAARALTSLSVNTPDEPMLGFPASPGVAAGILERRRLAADAAGPSPEPAASETVSAAPRSAMNPELHAFFLDPSASGHFLHAELSAAYRRACEQAGDRHELIAYTDEFHFLLEEIRDYLVDETAYPEYTGQLADLRTALSAIDARRAQASDLDIEIHQRLQEIEDLYASHDESLSIADDPPARSWLDARARIMAEVDRIRADPDMAPHLERIAASLNSLAHAELNTPHYRALHSFFLDDEASGQDIHSRLAPAYRRLSEEAGDRLEHLPFADGFEGFLDTVQDYVRDPDRDIDPEYRHQLTELFRLLRALEYGPEPVNELRGSILQSLDDLRTLEAEAAELSPGNAERRREAWLADAHHILATAEGFNSHPVLKPHAERLLTNLQELADAAASQSTAPFPPEPAAPEMVTAANQALRNAVYVASDPRLRPRLEPTLQRLRDALPELAQTSPPAPGTSQLVWAGIGARKTPRSVLADMTALSRSLAEAGWRLSSGGAHGADSAFAAGVPADQRTVWLPWPGYNEHSGPDCRVPSRERMQECLAIAERLHPAWHKCSQGARNLHARNVAILLGPELDRPVDAVVCWTEGGAVEGGTGMALRIAAERGIPVFNLGSMTVQAASEQLEQIQRALGPTDARTAALPRHRTGLDREAVSSQDPVSQDTASQTYLAKNACVFRFTKADWGLFSNFAQLPNPILATGRNWPTSEHLYQAAKFRMSPDVQQQIAGADRARDAAKLGRDRANTPDADWMSRRTDAMRWVIRMKREANPELVDSALERTGDRAIVEYSGHDAFWGAKPDGANLVGSNVLGRLWMELRQQIRDGDPRALASAWENPLTPAAITPADPARDERSHINQTYRALLAGSGNDPHLIPYQDNFDHFRATVSGAIEADRQPAPYMEKLRELDRRLQTDMERKETLASIQTDTMDLNDQLSWLNRTATAAGDGSIADLPQYPAFVQDATRCLERWTALQADPEARAHIEHLDDPVLDTRVYLLSDHVPVPEPATTPGPVDHPEVSPPSQHPIVREYVELLEQSGNKPELLVYQPAFHDFRETVHLARDDPSQHPDMAEALGRLSAKLKESHEARVTVANLRRRLTESADEARDIENWAAGQGGRTIQDSPRYDAWRTNADALVDEYRTMTRDSSLAPHVNDRDEARQFLQRRIAFLSEDRFARTPALSATEEEALHLSRAQEADQGISMSM